MSRRYFSDSDSDSDSDSNDNPIQNGVEINLNYEIDQYGLITHCNSSRSVMIRKNHSYLGISKKIGENKIFYSIIRVIPKHRFLFNRIISRLNQNCLMGGIVI